MNKPRSIILKLVAEGKIDVEEAEELLDAIDKGTDVFSNLLGAKQAGATAQARERAERAAEKAKQKAERVRARVIRPERRFEHNFQFDFPWNQADWQWPWESPDWEWPWEKKDAPKFASAVEVPEEALLKIKVDGGDLKIQGTDGESLKLNDPRAVGQITTEGNIVNISSGGSDLNIEVPAKVVSLEIALKGGNMKVQDLRADLVANVTGGDVSVSKAGGHIQASVSSGDVRLADVDSREIEVRTHSGDIYLNMTPVVQEGSVSLSSDSGDISVFLPPDSQCHISASAGGGGEISHSLPDEAIEAVDEARTRLSAKLNDGGAEFALSTRNGDISISIQAIAQANGS